MVKMCNNYFKDRTTPKCDLSFRTDPRVEDYYATSVPCSPDDLKKFQCQHGASFRSIYGEMQHTITKSRPDVACATNHNRSFQSYQLSLVFQEMDRMHGLLYRHSFKPLIFPKKLLPVTADPLNSPRILRAFW